MSRVSSAAVFVMIAIGVRIAMMIADAAGSHPASSLKSLAGEMQSRASQVTETLPAPPTPPARVASPVASPPVSTTAGAHPSPADLFKTVSPSVVRILSIDKKGQPLGQGSGFIASNTGLIVTNYHVVKGAASLTALLEGNKPLKIDGIASLDPEGDLALLKGSGDLPPPLRVAAGQLPAVGTRTYAIGNPLGLTNTLSEGLISGVRREPSGLTLVQTTAPISPGSSGGPLVDEDGTVLGVTTMCFVVGQNLNFAVDSARIRRLLDGYAGGPLKQPFEQNWTPSLSDRARAAHWLAMAYKETAKAHGQQERLFRAIAEACAASGDRDGCLRALDLWHMSVGNNNRAWGEDAAAAGVRARLGDADTQAASADLDASPNIRTRLLGHVAIANARAAAGDTAAFARHLAIATDLAKAQTDPVVRADGLIAVAQAHAQAGNFDAAMAAAALLTDTNNPELDAQGAATGSPRNARSVALAHIGLARAARREFDAAEALTAQMSDHADRAYLQVCIAQRAAEAGDPARAAAVAGRIAPPIYHAQALLHAARAYIAAGNRPAAKAALAEARALAKSAADSGRRGEFDVELVAVLADAGAFDSAATIAAAIPAPFVRAAAVGKIAAAHCRTGDYQRALAAIGANKNPLETIPAYTEVATTQAAAGHLRAAIDTAAHIPLGVARGDSLRAIFKAVATKVTVEELARAAAHFRTPDERAHACLGIAEGLLARDNPAPSQSPTTRAAVTR